ncbi:YueI family protein [Cerasibacillus sp.]|uniref:YueI family protein n=1 Tax=Cerasibacillus sp. TaxID=2498711 RepID=UPI0039C88665
MSTLVKKDVNNYLTDGIYGIRLPKQDERNKYLGTLRERIVLALTIGQVMSDKGLKALEEEMLRHPDAKLIFNGAVANKFLTEEKQLAEKYNIPYTVITNGEVETHIGAVLAYDFAIDKEEIFIKDKSEVTKQAKSTKKHSIFDKVIKNLFK